VVFDGGFTIWVLGRVLSSRCGFASKLSPLDERMKVVAGFGDVLSVKMACSR
jgi:hypothetical protein